MASTKKLVINAEKPSSKSILKKTSLEDLAENGFTIGRMCAQGTYSKVKIARFQGMEIAVKIIKLDKLSVQFRNKFLPRELDILTKVKHPNIVHVYKIFIYPKRIYIFMELIQKDLLQIIRENGGRLMEFQAHHYFKQLISALLYLHSLNLSHRDLKCENIMITDREEVKIVDFGFSRSTVTKEGRRMLSRTFCGSVTYAAPEVLQGIPYNPMMYDVWCLGCTLFIMVTGEIPFDDSNVRKMVMRQLNRQIQYPESVSVTEQVKTLISRMLEPDVIRRATLNQLSKSKWLKQESNFLPKHLSVDEYNIQDNYPTNNVSRGTQTCIQCEYYGRLRSWNECNCSSSSDDSD